MINELGVWYDNSREKSQAAQLVTRFQQKKTNSMFRFIVYGSDEGAGPIPNVPPP